MARFEAQSVVPTEAVSKEDWELVKLLAKSGSVSINKCTTLLAQAVAAQRYGNET